MPSPISSYAAALSAYAKAAGASSPSAPPATGSTTVPAGGGPSSGSFADTVKEMLNQAEEAGKSSEHQAMSALGGKGDIASVVTSVAEADVALQTVVAVRDRAVEAYKDIMRMTI